MTRVGVGPVFALYLVGCSRETGRVISKQFGVDFSWIRIIKLFCS